MEVRAITDGFHGGSRRRAGKTFDVADGETSNWFEPTNPEDATRAAAKPKGKGKGKAAPKPTAATGGEGAGEGAGGDDGGAGEGAGGDGGGAGDLV